MAAETCLTSLDDCLAALPHIKDETYDWEADCVGSYRVAIEEIARRVKGGEPLSNFPFLLGTGRFDVTR